MWVLSFWNQLLGQIMATSLKLLFEDIIQENEAVGSTKKKFGRCLVFKGFVGGGMFVFFARNYGVYNGTKLPSTYIYSWWFHVGTFVNYESHNIDADVEFQSHLR